MTVELATDRVAFVHFGTQTWHPEGINTWVEHDFGLTPTKVEGEWVAERVPAVILSFIPSTGSLRHWVALSPDDAAALAAAITSTLADIGEE